MILTEYSNQSTLQKSLSDEDVTKIKEKCKTPGFDPRFPNANQSYNCFVHYVDYYRCLDLLKDADAEKCNVFKKVFEALCPHAWVARWDDQREAGTFPRRIVQIKKYDSLSEQEKESLKKKDAEDTQIVKAADSKDAKAKSAKSAKDKEKDCKL